MSSTKELSFDEQRQLLIEEFPELLSNDVILQKEIYAHCGLLFFGFALVEHSLINISTFSYVASRLKKQKIKNSDDWEKSWDIGYEKSCNLTFGNLVK